MGVISAGSQFTLESNQWVLKTQGDPSSINMTVEVSPELPGAGVGIWFRFGDNGSLIFDLSRLTSTKAFIRAEIKSPLDFRWTLSSLNTSEGYGSSGQMLARGAQGCFLTVSRDGGKWLIETSDVTQPKTEETPSAMTDFVVAQANARERSGVTVIFDSSSVNLSEIPVQRIEKFLDFVLQLSRAFGLQDYKIVGGGEGPISISTLSPQNQAFSAISSQIEHGNLHHDPARVALRNSIESCGKGEQFIVVSDGPFFISEETQAIIDSNALVVDIICLGEGEMLSSFDSSRISLISSRHDLDSQLVQKALLA